MLCVCVHCVMGPHNNVCHTPPAPIPVWPHSLHSPWPQQLAQEAAAWRRTLSCNCTSSAGSPLNTQRMPTNNHRMFHCELLISAWVFNRNIVFSVPCAWLLLNVIRLCIIEYFICRSLRSRDKFSHSDPFCVVYTKVNGFYIINLNNRRFR